MSRQIRSIQRGVLLASALFLLFAVAFVIALLHAPRLPDDVAASSGNVILVTVAEFQLFVGAGYQLAAAGMFIASLFFLATYVSLRRFN